ncbi:MAG TPA: ABC transporter permease subunit [Gaiella sp.]|nr:ABC transporter permease subunit [Gaiella sp.]
MIGSVRAELLLMQKRASTWILLGIWVALALMFAYVVAYVTYLNGSGREPLEVLLPQSLVGTLLAGFPFFGGVLALMLGVLTFGSDYGWGTLKTVLTQRPGRLEVFVARVLALAVALVPFVLVVFGLGALASLAIAVREGADIAWPEPGLLLAGMLAGWLLLAVWAALGVLLAVLSRGTALATGIGILYALVVEGLLSALASQVSVLDRLVELFLRANAYSLAVTVGVSREEISDAGPGSFSGPFVDGGQALLLLGAYGAVFLAVSGWLLSRRDVT